MTDTTDGAHDDARAAPARTTPAPPRHIHDDRGRRAHGGDAESVTWIVQVPWQPAVPSTFAHASTLLRGLDAACRYGSDAVPPLWQHLLYAPECARTRRRRAAFLLRHPAVHWHVEDVPADVARRATPAALAFPSSSWTARHAATQGDADTASPRRGVPVIDGVARGVLDKTHVELVHWAAVAHAVAHDGVLPYLELGGVLSCGLLARPLLAVLQAVVPAFAARFAAQLAAEHFHGAAVRPLLPPDATTPVVRVATTSSAWLQARRHERAAQTAAAGRPADAADEDEDETTSV